MSMSTTSTRTSFFVNRRSRPLRRALSAVLSTAVAAAGFTSGSCAAPRMPYAGHGLRAAGGGYELQVMIDGVPAPSFERAGETYILGRLGARYTLRIGNNTGRRIEAVVSVDGRDAIDGKAADVRTKRGYVVPAWGAIDVDGWRLSHAQAAAFRFSSVADSYAARTGSARDVGVIGVAVFPERDVPPPRPLYTPLRRLPHSSSSPWDDEGRTDGLDQLLNGSRRGAAAASGAAGRRASNDENKAAPTSDSGSASPLDGGSLAPSTLSKSLPQKQSAADNQNEPLSGTRTGGHARAEAPRSSSPAASPPWPRHRPGLGTEFGEAVTSHIRDIEFARANSVRPATVVGTRYNDRDGLLALGIDVDAQVQVQVQADDCCVSTAEDLAWRQSATPFPSSDRRRYAVPPPGWHRGCCVR